MSIPLSDRASALAHRFPGLAVVVLGIYGRVRRAFGRSSEPSHWVYTRISDELGFRDRVIARLTNGMKIGIVWNDVVGRSIYDHGVYEPDTVAFVEKAMSSGGNFFDVGAQVGQYTLVAAGIADSGKVHAFEPDPATAAMLRHNVDLNALTNVVVNQVAVADDSEPKTLYLASSRNIGMNSLSVPASFSGEQLQVDCVTLDEYCEQNGIDEIDIVKIDVEGAEMIVLDGFDKVLRSAKRRPILILESEERQLHAQGVSRATMEDRLTGLGYKIFVYPSGKELIAYEPEQWANERLFNIYAVPEERLESVLELFS